MLATLKNYLTYLSSSGTADIRHLARLNIKRTGTPLQMALYSQDEDIIAYFKTVMDPTEFERQSKEVFSKALPLNKQTELAANNAPALTNPTEDTTFDPDELCVIKMT
ncbi:MAG: hypothetical protein Q8L78_06885 [Coxiellaceae bacterium]|nr:hypothetical protein [Coxiellaceae bacterium]